IIHALFKKIIYQSIAIFKGLLFPIWFFLSSSKEVPCCNLLKLREIIPQVAETTTYSLR
ncbi:hypothetical protein ACJX0J_010096, partial [Zea mays]